MVKDRMNFVVSVLFLMMGLLFFKTSFDYAAFTPTGAPGAGLVPRWLSAALVILAVVYLVQSIKKPAEVVYPEKKHLKRILLIFIAVFIFIVLCKPMGFSIPFCIMMFMLFYGTFKWPVNLGISIGVTVLMYIIFIMWLKLPLPVNQFGI